MTRTLVFAAALLAALVFVRPLSADSYVLLVGINDYRSTETGLLENGNFRHGLFPLSFCVNDMSGLKEALVIGSHATTDNIRLMTTSEDADSDNYPTARNIKRQLKDLAAKAGPRDTILFAFAGHGIAIPCQQDSTETEQFLCPADAELVRNAKSSLFETETLISQQFVDNVLENSRARAKIVVYDACRNVARHDGQSRSAALDSKSFSRSVSMGLKSFDIDASTAAKAEGFYVLSSCSKSQESLEDGFNLEHGVFSYYLIEGLKGKADHDGDGQITMEELYEWAHWNTKDHATKKLSKEQEPTFSTREKKGNLVIARCEPGIKSDVYAQQKQLEAKLAELEAANKKLEQERRVQATVSPSTSSPNYGGRSSGYSSGNSGYRGGNSGYRSGGQGTRVNKM